MKQFVAQFGDLFSFFALSPLNYLTLCYATHRVLNRFWHLHHASITQNNNLVTPIREKNLFCVLRVNSQILNHYREPPNQLFHFFSSHHWACWSVGGPCLNNKTGSKSIFALCEFYVCQRTCKNGFHSKEGWHYTYIIIVWLDFSKESTFANMTNDKFSFWSFIM